MSRQELFCCYFPILHWDPLVQTLGHCKLLLCYSQPFLEAQNEDVKLWPCLKKSRTSSMVKAACENGCARTFHRSHMSSFSPSDCKSRYFPEMQNSLLSKDGGIKVWFCSVLKVKEHHLKSWRERTVCQENGSSCLLSRLKDRAGELFFSARAQTAKPLTNLAVYLSLFSRKKNLGNRWTFPISIFHYNITIWKKNKQTNLKEIGVSINAELNSAAGGT